MAETLFILFIVAAIILILSATIKSLWPVRVIAGVVIIICVILFWMGLTWAEVVGT